MSYEFCIIVCLVKQNVLCDEMTLSGVAQKFVLVEPLVFDEGYVAGGWAYLRV
jgi:hypothetical protein